MDEAESVLGWRQWALNYSLETDRLALFSPVYRMEWTSAEMRAENWGKAAPNPPKVGSIGSTNFEIPWMPGIHATRYDPNWLTSSVGNQRTAFDRTAWGLVERHGGYVRGERGWRSEWAVIRALWVTNGDGKAEKLQQVYPEAEIHTFNPPIWKVYGNHWVLIEKGELPKMGKMGYGESPE